VRLGSGLVAAVLACTAILGMLVLVPTDAAATDVFGGVIAQNETWTSAGSPYRIYGDVIVGPGAVLTIGPGVTVLFQGNYSLQGSIFANGKATAPVDFRPVNPSTLPDQWGPLTLRGGRHVRVSNSRGLDLWGGSLERCEVSRSEYGVRLGPDVRARLTDCTLRDIRSDALILSGSLESVVANLTIERVGTAVALLHVGQPDTGADAARNLITHLRVSGAGEGVRRTIGTYGGAGGNLLVYSRFEDVATVFADPFPGTAHHNAFSRYQADFRGTHPAGSYDDGAEGNYWDTYAGADLDGDGIGDTPHGADRFPLVAAPPGAGTYAATPPAPWVMSTSPAPGAADVPSRAPVLVRFNEGMSTTFLPSEALVAAPELHGPSAWNTSRALEALPSGQTSALARNTTYEVRVAGWLPSLHGVPLGADFVLTFSTRPPPDVLSSDPAAGEEEVPVTSAIVLRFRVPMNTSSVEEALLVGGGLAVDLEWNPARDELRIVPRVPLQAGRLYGVEIGPTARDDEGMLMPRYQVFFRTAESVPSTWAPGGEMFVVALAAALAIVGVLAWVRVRRRRGS